MSRLALVVIAVVAVGCDDNDSDNGIIGGGGAGTIEWRASPLPTDASNPLRGNAIVLQNFNEQAFDVSIAIRNDVPGAARPWHVHFGTCAATGAIVGDDRAYPRLMVDSNGEAAIDIVIGAALDPAADYSVNVHESDAKFSTIIACGDLVLQ